MTEPGFTVFVCQNRRPASHREGSCHARGGPELLAAFELAAAGRPIDVRPAPCLDACPRGPVAGVWAGRGRKHPPGKLARLWDGGMLYGPLVPRDAAAIVAAHLAGETVPRLKVP